MGNVPGDLPPDGSFSLGGPVTFAALTAYRLGLVAAVVTCADAELLAELPARLPEIGLAANPSPAPTAFVNTYHEGFRTQYLRARAGMLSPEHVPELWLSAPVVLLGPLAQELSPSLVMLFPHHPGVFVSATPPGWVRRWDEDGRIWPT